MVRSGGLVDVRVTQFFDRAAVRRRLDRRKRGLLSRAGSFIRTAAKSSLKRARQKGLGEMTAEERERYEIRRAIARRKGLRTPRRPERVSEPGQPPFLHVRPSPLKRLIYFAYDPARDSVVVGPLRFGPAGAEALEYGGPVCVRRTGRTVRTRRRRVRIRARPFMRPALGKGLEDLKRKGRTSLPLSACNAQAGRFWDNIVRT